MPSPEIISIESGNNTPLIGSSYFKTTAKQGDLIEIPLSHISSLTRPRRLQSRARGISTQTRTVSRT